MATALLSLVALAFAPPSVPSRSHAVAFVRGVRVSAQAGGPPAGVQSGAGGPPVSGGGPPAGGRGGPPPRTPVQQLLDNLFDFSFTLLYAFEPEGMLDSSKNLRVLWVRALLAASGRLDDPIAKELLPAATRWCVGPAVAPLWTPVLPKLEWIQQRTEFIDGVLSGFLETARKDGRAQAVLIGSGYDTRALRFSSAPVDFYEVDLPGVLEVKKAMCTKYAGAAAADAAAERSLGLDLNREASEMFPRLEKLGLKAGVPTIVVSEAVLFYLSPPAKRALLEGSARHIRRAPGSALALTDNLAPFVRSPGSEEAAQLLEEFGLSLEQHSSLWGGAIQFIHATAKAN
ncbi:hypothetical protein AB1Y20_006908 [Prymnesium parvum]|uniref:S-adenosyl-L-methionine-dependent methyltransferase n=1 Tax=Prymnesium parvum TaxID=97485 RepID=A0AB34J346_PRYPA